MKKRDFLKTAGILGAGALLSPSIAYPGIGIPGKGLEFELPELGFAFNALEPAIDAMTMEIHHGKHHAAYVTNLNKAVTGNPRFENRDIDYLMSIVTPDESAVRNNGGGHWNHTAFWKWISPGGNKAPSAAMLDAINAAFGSVDEFKKQFSDAAKNRFGSGWAWLSVDGNKKLFVSSTANQDNPLMLNVVDKPGKPILGVDVWEHAYYLKYQNKRADYINGFFEIINWDQVTAMYLAAIR